MWRRQASKDLSSLNSRSAAAGQASAVNSFRLTAWRSTFPHLREAERLLHV